MWEQLPGPVLISSVIAVIGYFIKKELQEIGERLSDHDDKIFEMSNKVQELIGAFNARQRERFK